MRSLALLLVLVAVLLLPAPVSSDTLHLVIRANRVDQAHAWIARHGWTRSGTRPPSSELEESASLDWLGGGDRTFSVPLVRVVAPDGPIVAYAAVGWRLTTARATLLRSVLVQSGWSYSRLDQQVNGDDLIWWRDSQTSFVDGIAQIRPALTVYSPDPVPVP